MAMFPCPDCKKMISEDAQICPKCGRIIDPLDVKKYKEEYDKNKKKAKKILIAGIFVIVISASLPYLIKVPKVKSNNTYTSQIEVNNEIYSEENPLEVDISVKIAGETGKPLFLISTNLPDDTELMLTLSNNNGYKAQTKILVLSGRALSEEFSKNGNPLTGKYNLTVSMSLPKLQSEKVRKIIGENGEYITGKFVNEDKSIHAEFIYKN